MLGHRKVFYVKLGWQPHATNWHVELSPLKNPKPAPAQERIEDNLTELCRRDEQIIREAMTRPSDRQTKVLRILPDIDHMLWHIGKEIFATERVFGKIPRAKGAIAGSPGDQVWAIWTHRYYRHPDAESSSNVLFILRLVVEDDVTANSPRSTRGA